eukprot:7894377-Pyramimonas_sp.AAC.1
MGWTVGCVGPCVQGCLGSLLGWEGRGASGAVIEASEFVLGLSWASWSARLASRGSRGPSWRLL